MPTSAKGYFLMMTDKFGEFCITRKCYISPPGKEGGELTQKYKKADRNSKRFSTHLRAFPAALINFVQ